MQIWLPLTIISSLYCTLGSGYAKLRVANCQLQVHKWRTHRLWAWSTNCRSASCRCSYIEIYPSRLPQLSHGQLQYHAAYACMHCSYKNAHCTKLCNWITVSRMPGQQIQTKKFLRIAAILVWPVKNHSYYRSYSYTFTLFLLKRSHRCLFCPLGARQEWGKQWWLANDATTFELAKASCHIMTSCFWHNEVCIRFHGNRQIHTQITHTHTHTEQRTTVTLSAHACRGLISPKYSWK